MKQNIGKKIACLYLSGLSVNQISENLNIGSSKVRHSLVIQSIPRRDHSSASRMLHTTKFGKSECTIKEQLNPEEENLRIAGAMLYWGEGTKAGNSVVLSNSDPDMIRLFLQFLRDVCRVSETRLRALIHIYPDQDEGKIKHFWSDITGIPVKQFSKTSLHKRTKGTYKKVSHYGTLSLRYSDTELLKTINKWISNYKTPV